MIQITHLRDKCIGCNSCVENAPQRWSISTSDGKADLLHATKNGKFYVAVVSDDEYEQNQKAAADCPMHIISVERKMTKKK